MSAFDCASPSARAPPPSLTRAPRADSKWDNIEDSDEEGAPDAGAICPVAPPAAAPAAAGDDAPPMPGMTRVDDEMAAKIAAEDPEAARLMAQAGLPAGMRSAGKVTSKGSEKGRFKFEHEGRTIYEWEQSLEEINLYVQPPEGVRPEMIACKITPTHLSLGLRGNPPFLDEDTYGPVVEAESFWMMNDGEITVNLQKMRKGETWDAALKGRGGASVDPFTKQEIQKQLMLERFQEENPGFDFSGASFNGQVPDPKNFMGGVGYNGANY